MFAPTQAARFVARAAVVVCSLCVAAYLVVKAQPAARSPVQAEVNAAEHGASESASDADPAAPRPAQSLAIVAESAPGQPAATEPPTFLFSSKSLGPTPGSNSMPPVEHEAPASPFEAELPVFLPSSKIRLSTGLVRPVLTPGTEPVEAPAHPVEKP